MFNKTRIKENKGFTIVELVVAVAILAVAVSPLLYSFVTSANMDKRSRDIGAATLAAQNVQELVTASTVKQIRSGSCFSELGIASPTSLDEGAGLQWLLPGLEQGGQTYDAVVTLDSEAFSAEGADRNAIPAFSSLDAVYNQPKDGYDDPDQLALEGKSSAASLRRTIRIDITSDQKSETVDGESVDYTLAYAKVTYTYENTEDGSKQPYIYELNPNGCKLSGDKTAMNVYLMYNIWRADEIAAGVVGVEEEIEIYNTNDVPVNVFLISQSGKDIHDRLTIRQYQTRNYSKSNETAFVYTNADVYRYQVFTGNVWYYTSAVNASVVADKESPILYGVTIDLYAPGTSATGECLYSLSASKRG